MESVLLDIIRGPKELISSRLKREFPELMTDEDFATMMRYGIGLSMNLEMILTLAGFLPGLDQISLYDKIKYYDDVPKVFRKAVTASICDELTPQVVDEISDTNSNYDIKLLHVGIDANDYDLVWHVMKLIYDNNGSAVIIDIFNSLEDDNYVRLFDLLYTLYAEDQLTVKTETIISKFLFHTYGNGKFIRYIIRFICVLKKMTLREVFDYYMTLDHSKKKESINVYDSFTELGVRLTHMVEWDRLHPGNRFLEEYLRKATVEDI